MIGCWASCILGRSKWFVINIYWIKTACQPPPLWSLVLYEMKAKACRWCSSACHWFSFKPKTWGRCVFVHWCVHTLHLCMCAHLCVYKSALTSSITSSGLWEPSREPHQPPLWWWHTWFMAFRDRLFSLRLLVSSLKLHHSFVQRKQIWARMRGKNFKRRVFLALEETKGLGLGIKRRNLSQDNGCPRLLFPPSLGFGGGQGFMICQSLGKVGVERVWKSQRSNVSWNIQFCLSSSDFLLIPLQRSLLVAPYVSYKTCWLKVEIKLN